MVPVICVNPPKPGQRSGSIKFDNNDRVGVLPNQLGLFSRGQTVTIEYKDRQGSDGKWWKDFVSFSGQEGTGNGYAPAPAPAYRPAPPQQVTRPAAPRPTLPQPPRPQQGHDYNTGKQIAVTGITQRAVQIGKFEIADIPTIMRVVAATYDEIFLGVAPVVQRQTYDRGQPAGPRDDIPFNDSVDDLGMEEPPY